MNDSKQKALLHECIRSLLVEGVDDIIDLIILVRIKITGKYSPKMADILTDIRGIEHVITVKQHETLSSPDLNGRQTGKLTVRYDEDHFHTMKYLLDAIIKVEGIDMVKVLTYNDIRYDIILKNRQRANASNASVEKTRTAKDKSKKTSSTADRR